MIAESNMIALSTQAPEFRLADVLSGRPVSLHDFREKHALLVAFICGHCPHVLHIRDEFVRIADEYIARGAGVVAISSNDYREHPEDSPENLAKMARGCGFKFPLLYDPSQTVAKSFGAACTPDFFLYDEDMRLAYRGQMDRSRPPRGVCDGADLRAALEAALAGWPVNTDQKPSSGSAITWRKQ